MNEKYVWELWSKCKHPHPKYGGGDMIFPMEFAELIVQEILRMLEQYSRDSFPEDFIDNFDKGYLAGLCTAQEAVKKHFGVEE